MQKNSTHKIVIEVKNLSKSYKQNNVLKDVSFTVKKGTMLALLGPNGAGKTTCVRILSTLLGYDGGQVSVEGINVREHPDQIRRIIGLTGQSAAVDEILTGRENLVMMGQLYRLTKQSARERAEELLGQFDLVDAASRSVKTYSGGMRRRLDLAVSLIAAPPIIFLDEPTTGLDPRSRLAMWDVIRRLMKQGTTILLTTQYLEEADQLADNIVMINNGTVVAEGTPKQLKQQMGKDQLELQFKDKKTYMSAADVLADESPITQDEKMTIQIAIDQPNHDVRRILDTLASSSIELEALSVHKPSLDDVFMSLTGSNTDVSDDQTEKKDQK